MTAAEAMQKKSALREKALNEALQRTAALDEKYNFFEHRQAKNTDVCELIDLWQNDAFFASCVCFYNIFEDVIPTDNTDVDTIKRFMREGGACSALMSGSGSTIFGLVSSEDDGRKIVSSLRSDGYSAWCVETYCPVV